MLRKLLIGAAALTMMTGAALAQDAGSTTGALDNPEMMKPFYSDTEMKTMRTGDEFTAAIKAMTEENRTTVSKECENVTTQHSSFCKAFNDANK